MMQTTAWPDVDFPLGAHIVTPRRWYTHHGIYVGAGQVVHYQGLSTSLRRGRIAKVSLAEFAGGRSVHVRDEAQAVFADFEVVARACSRLGEGAYDVLRNNCEHFCSWCAVGVARSSQVERLLSNPRALTFAARLLTALINGWTSTRDALPLLN
ncbi:lecithin retinol acyltransferase family protein [Variovorax ginsengisoli]|uniref:Lecithin retinol acyltransferase family protein n=1 Tax=Variovorax ginsengisoli TaxID=363844 RepID=A0ABT8SDS1_9BURK|nr:lecithin retinol acyltransferase family protein [Variovorax ginsengisoli]MDN8617899.1 lecithin retinol acyltransferase family protein [Variovorax ginsengisoli]MDO1537069.1 lecithin retinol acyltransferase family protein [Variovorax ginsengisoli]